MKSQTGTNKSKTASVHVRLDPATAKRFRVKLARLGLKAQHVLDELIRQWIDTQ